MSTQKAQDLKVLITGVIAFFTALWGWLGWAVVMLILAMAADYITGSIAARSRGEWSSAIARAGLRHKLGTVIAVGVAAAADLGVRVILMSDELPDVLHGVTWPRAFTLIVTFWYFLTELGSILENAGKLGAKIHPWIAKGIAVLSASITPDDAAPASESTLDTPAPYKGQHEALPSDAWAAIAAELDAKDGGKTGGQ